MNPWIIVLIAFAAFLVLLSIVIAILVFHNSARRLIPKEPAKPEDDIYFIYSDIMNAAKTWFDAQQTEELWIRSYDGLALFGRWVPRENAKGTILMMHGYHGEAMKDFAASMRYCYEAGYNLLLPDERTHGRSEGRYITFGLRERRDLLDWLEVIGKRAAGTPVYLYGVSMGCSTILMVSGMALPDTVRGLIADCGYTRPWDICAHVLKRYMHMPVFPVLYIVAALTRLLAGFGLKQTSCPETLKKNTRPVLFYHGGKDDFVPLWMGNENYAACMADKKQIIVAEAGHAQSFLVEQQRCLNELGAFLEKCSG